MIELITASYDQNVLSQQLARSPYISQTWYPEIKIMRGYNNVAKAYNECDVKSKYNCYLHEDVYLPGSFMIQVLLQLYKLPENFGVVGVAGVKLVDGKKENYGYVSDRGRAWAYNVGNLPAEVQTVDELLFITHGDIVFDENLPLDFYAADACMQMIAQGRKNYVVNAYVEHNSTRPIGGRTPAFYEAEKYFKNKWRDYRPIATTCSLML